MEEVKSRRLEGVGCRLLRLSLDLSSVHDVIDDQVTGLLLVSLLYIDLLIDLDPLHQLLLLEGEGPRDPSKRRTALAPVEVIVKVGLLAEAVAAVWTPDLYPKVNSIDVRCQIPTVKNK